MYNLTKWLGNTAILGIHMSPSLGIPCCFSANIGDILRKIGGEVKLGLQVWGRRPPSCSIYYLHPNFNSSIKPTVNYLYGDISNSSLVWIYSYNVHHSKSWKTQNYGPSLWPVLHSIEIKPTDNLLLTNFLSHFLHRHFLSTRRRHDLQHSFYPSSHRFFLGC